MEILHSSELNGEVVFLAEYTDAEGVVVLTLQEDGASTHFFLNVRFDWVEVIP